MQGRVVRILSKDYTVLLEDGRRVNAVALGRLRRGFSPVVGDLVSVRETHHDWGIEKIEKRRSCLIRPACANVDQALIVMSVKEPDFSTALIDRLSSLIMHAGITPLLCVTKCDLGIDETTEREIREYEAGEMRVIRNGKDSLNPAFADLFRDKITVLTGQSGAGKARRSMRSIRNFISRPRRSPKPWEEENTRRGTANSTRSQGVWSRIRRASPRLIFR